MNYIAIIMLLMGIYICVLNRNNKKLQNRADAELRYVIASRQLEEWNNRYGK
jgi:hypothetical protein